jgi:hypothetical protein
MKKKYFIPLITVPAIVVSVVVGFLMWAQIYYQPTERALNYLNSDENVEVVINGDIKFSPRQNIKKPGFIFYPGGKVDEKAYSYLGYEIAKEGYTVIIAKMPLRLAIFKTGAAAGIIEKNNGIDTWVIGGHSLGGSAAAIFTANNPGQLDGIVFLASYPANSSDLSKNALEALSITGSKDGIINIELLVNTKELLPEKTGFVDIDGGNHSQFGDYGLQSGDNAADIGIELQHELVVQNILQLLESLN